MQKIKNNEFGYLGNPSVKRDGVETEFSKSEIKEYMKCMKDPVYFAKKYVKIISIDEGENWQESSYPIYIINQGENDEKRFEKC